MKKTGTFLLGTFLFAEVTAQKMPADYFDEGAGFVQAKQYDKAVVAYKYIVDNHPKNDLYPEAFYNLACTYYLQKDYPNATALFRAVLFSDFNEMKPIGGDIMSSPYANFRHRAAAHLSRIYDERKTYDSALYYLGLSDSVYQYKHFCGNEMDENEVYLSLRYADLYQKVKQRDKAITALLRTVFITYLADNKEVLQTLKALLKKKKVQGLKKDLDSAVAHMYVKPSNGQYRQFYIRFLGNELKTPGVWDKEKPSKEEAIRKVKASAFYQLISRL